MPPLDTQGQKRPEGSVLRQSPLFLRNKHYVHSACLNHAGAIGPGTLDVFGKAGALDARIPISSGSRFITRGDHVHLLERLPTLPKGAKLKLPNTTAAEIAPLTPFTHLVRCDMGTQLTLVPIDFAPSPVTTSSSTNMTFLTLENYAREN